MVIRRVDKNFKLVFLFYTLFIFFVFSVLKILAAPDTPTNSTPADSATGVSVTPTLTSSAYSNGKDNATGSDGFVDREASEDASGRNLESGDIITSTPGGVSSEAVTFDGVDEDIYRTNPAFKNDKAAGGRSLSFYVKIDDANSNNRFFSVNDFSAGSGSETPFWTIGYVGHVSPNRWITQSRRWSTAGGGSYFNPQNQWANSLPSSGVWYHIVLTTDDSTQKLYRNGSLVTQTTNASANWFGDGGDDHSSLILTSTAEFQIGGHGASTRFEGDIDEVTIWSTELDSTEVSELYNSGTPIDPTTHSEVANLQYYWPLGEELEHTASQWQITSTSGDYSTPVYDSGTDTTNLTSITVPGGSALSEGTTYYWRVRHQDEEGDWSSWSTETSFTTESSGTLSVDIVDAGGTTVGSPSVSMDPVTFSFSDQTATGTFGVSDEKIRVENSTGTATWNLSLAASATTDVWDSAGTDYDFNDPTASAGDGGDADSVGGQMTIDPTGITITPEGGCTSTNISAGSSSAFSEGVTDSITIASAAPGADTGCYWDITGVDISQTIPAGQPAASDYNIDMVLSIVAS